MWSPSPSLRIPPYTGALPSPNSTGVYRVSKTARSWGPTNWIRNIVTVWSVTFKPDKLPNGRFLSSISIVSRCFPCCESPFSRPKSLKSRPISTRNPESSGRCRTPAQQYDGYSCAAPIVYVKRTFRRHA